MFAKIPLPKFSSSAPLATLCLALVNISCSSLQPASSGNNSDAPAQSEKARAFDLMLYLEPQDSFTETIRNVKSCIGHKSFEASPEIRLAIESYVKGDYKGEETLDLLAGRCNQFTAVVQGILCVTPDKSGKGYLKSSEISGFCDPGLLTAMQKFYEDRGLALQSERIANNARIAESDVNFLIRYTSAKSILNYRKPENKYFIHDLN